MNGDPHSARVFYNLFTHDVEVTAAEVVTALLTQE